MRVECVLSVLFSAGSSSVQQHRCGQPLPGQRQRQVPPRHDHLPVPDHLPALEQHRRRRQVGLCSWTFIRRMKVNMGSSPLSLQGGEEPEREDLWPSSRGGLPGHLQVGVFCVGSVDHVAPSVVFVVPQIRGGDGEVHGSDELLVGPGRTRRRDRFQPLLLPEHRGSRRWDPERLDPPYPRRWSVDLLLTPRLHRGSGPGGGQGLPVLLGHRVRSASRG